MSVLLGGGRGFERNPWWFGETDHLITEFHRIRSVLASRHARHKPLNIDLHVALPRSESKPHDRRFQGATNEYT
jgi:hypothetical protein